MISFAYDTLFAILLTYATGAALLRSLRIPWTWAFMCAPAASLCVYSLLGELYYVTGIAATPLTVFIIPLGVLLAISLLSQRLDQGEMDLPAIDWHMVILYVAVGIALGGFYFLRSLHSFDGISQSEDIVKHALQVRAFVDSEKFTSLHASVYLDNLGNAPFYSTTAFYPCAWHVLCALVVQLGGGGVTTAMNAVNFMLAYAIYPLSTLTLLSTLFDDRRPLLLIGSIACMSIVAFPWLLLIFGPLYPNLCGYVCIPAVAALFIHSTSHANLSKTEIAKRMCAFVICGIGMALIHPNTVFSAAVLLIPYCCWRVAHMDIHIFSYHTTSRQRYCCTALLFALVWFVLYSSPTFQSVTTFNWPAYVSPKQALINILSLNYANSFVEFSPAPQPFVAIVLLIGCASLARDRRLRWLLASYVLACFSLFICACTDGDFKHVLCGFWYTDPVRLGANIAIIAVPLVAVGLYRLWEPLCALLDHARTTWAHRESLKACAPYLSALILAFTIFAPNLEVPGWFAIDSTFVAFRSQTKSLYHLENPYKDQEGSFVNKALKIIGDDTSPIINNPLDGSLLSYGINDLRCYYRIRFGYNPASETPESYLIRKRLYEISYDEEVQQAVKKVGTHYVIRLDLEDQWDSFLKYYWFPDRFTGITNITPDTPGFELILQEGDMQLYRILEQ